MFSRLFPRHKARADQAGFIRRGLAFGIDALIIAVLSSLVYTGYAELRARLKHDPSPVSIAIKALEDGSETSLTLERGLQVEQDKKQGYLDLLKGRITEEEYQKAESMTANEIEKNYTGTLVRARIERARESTPKKSRQRAEDQAYKVIKEYIITLLYFVLFFRFGGQTPGKRVLCLKVIDLEGKPRLSWYQCFERAHGYVCSGLFASLGFWQVLWDRHGLTMHDKIADTTVIRLPKRPREKKKSQA
ncbi:MAG: RDD family protein [Candidatus Saccharicenans sp.]|uniref:RDD family protein n=1 Tax=Candidatus Saccharicenans sp. TaxID=2819258 RepID=UPI00404934D8